MASFGTLLVPLSMLVTPGPTPAPAHTGRIEQITDQIASRQSVTPVWVVVVTGLMAFVVGGGFVVVDWMTTATHEGAHVVAGSAMGQLQGVIIPPKHSKEMPHTKAVLDGPFRWFLGMFVGYLGPSLFGLLGAFLLSRDHVEATLWSAIALLVGLLGITKNPFGVFVVLLLAGGLLAVAWSDAPGLHTVVAYLLVWSLLWAGIQDVLKQGSAAARKADAAARKAKAKQVSDHMALRNKTLVPRFIWVLVHLVLGIGAFYLGARLMLF